MASRSKRLIEREMNLEVKGMGRVVNPAPLAALVNELASAEAAYQLPDRTGSDYRLSARNKTPPFARCKPPKPPPDTMNSSSFPPVRN